MSKVTVIANAIDDVVHSGRKRFQLEARLDVDS